MLPLPGYLVTLLDNLSNSFLEVLPRLQALAGDKAGSLRFVQVTSFSSFS